MEFCILVTPNQYKYNYENLLYCHLNDGFSMFSAQSESRQCACEAKTNQYCKNKLPKL